METARLAKPISGEKLYQKRARQALPLLVRQVRAVQSIYYSDLAHELGMRNPRNLNYVLGYIGTTIEDLSKSWGERIPPIQCLVVNKTTRLPGAGVGRFITGGNFRELPRRQQRMLVDEMEQQVFLYSKWDGVLAALKLSPIPTDFSRLVAQAAAFRSTGESEDHKYLKLYVAGHPESVGLDSNMAKGKIEYLLPSGDALDVFFQDKKDWIGIEVKSSLSNDSDITRGLFQCVKYRAVIEAVQASQGLDQNARVILVLESTLPEELIGLKNILGIEIVDKVVPDSPGLPKPE